MRLIEYDPNNPTAVAPWIVAADDLDQMINEGYKIKPFTKAMLTESIKAYTMFLTIGPIGCGKTTASDMLAKKLPNTIHVDGDTLNDMDEQTVLALGPERNYHTISKVAKCMVAGKIPILSTGGGVLLGVHNKVTGISEIENLVKGPVRVILVVPGPGECWGNVLPKDFLKHTYENKHRVIDTVTCRFKRREEAGEQAMKPGEVSNLCAKLANISSKNWSIAQMIIEKIEQTSTCLTFPLVHNGEIPEPPPWLLESIPQPSPDPTQSLMVTQHRDLYLVEPCDICADMPPDVKNMFTKKERSSLVAFFGSDRVCHKTLLFSPKPVTVSVQTDSKDSEDSKDSKEEIRRQLTIFNLKDMSIAFCVIMMDETSDQHLTVKSGNHKPVQMRTVAGAYNSGAKEVTLSATITEGKRPNQTITTVDVTYPLRKTNTEFAVVETHVTIKRIGETFIYGK
jgi:energy-coupling factor transporter ATP-binding protein EcfA2